MNLIKNVKIDLYRAFSGKLFLIGLLCTQGVFYLNIPWDNIGQSVISPSRTEISQDFVLDILAGTHPYAYLFVNAAAYALGSAVFAVLALLISSFTHNIFVTIMSPMVMYFLFTSITQILHLPADLSIIFLIEGYVFSYAHSAVFTFFYVFIFWTVLLVFLDIYLSGMQKRGS